MDRQMRRHEIIAADGQAGMQTVSRRARTRSSQTDRLKDLDGGGGGGGCGSDGYASASLHYA